MEMGYFMKMKNKFNYDDWVDYYLRAYNYGKKASWKIKHPWTIELNKRFYEQEGYYLSTGGLISVEERNKMGEIANKMNEENS